MAPQSSLTTPCIQQPSLLETPPERLAADDLRSAGKAPCPTSCPKRRRIHGRLKNAQWQSPRRKHKLSFLGESDLFILTIWEWQLDSSNSNAYFLFCMHSPAQSMAGLVYLNPMCCKLHKQGEQRETHRKTTHTHTAGACWKLDLITGVRTSLLDLLDWCSSGPSHKPPMANPRPGRSGSRSSSRSSSS